MLGTASDTAEEALFSQAIWAMNASLSSKTSKAERESSEKMLTSLKNSKKEGLVVFARILRSDNNNLCGESLKLLTLTLYNDWIRIWWDQLTEQEVAALKQHVCQEIVMHQLVLTNNQAIKNKVAVVLCNLAERLFSQRWPMMVQEFLSIWLQSEYQRQEVMIKTFEFITTDCVDADFNNSLPTLRRQEIIMGLVEHQHELLQTAFQYLNFCRERQVVLQQQMMIGEELNSIHVAVLSLFTMLTALADLVKPEELLSSLHDFLEPTCLPDVLAAESFPYHQRAPSIMIQAAQFLLSISRQKISVDVFVKLVSVFCHVDVSQRFPEDVEEMIRFQRLYSQALHNIISQNMHMLVGMDKQSNFFIAAASIVDSPEQCLQLYTAKLLSFVVSPSRKLALDVVKDWLKIYRTDGVKQLAAFESICMSVLNEYMQKGKKPLWCELPGVQTDDIFEIEFEDHDEWNEFHGTFKSHVKLLAQAIASNFPILMAQTLSGYLMQLMSATATSSGPVACKTLQLKLDIFHVIYATLLKEGLESDSKATAEAATKAEYEMISNAILNVASTAYTQVLQWRPDDSSLVSEQLKLIQYHSPMLKRLSGLLGQTLSYLFDLMLQSYEKRQLSKSGSNDKIGSDSLGSNEVINKISSCLSAVTKACAQDIVKSDFFQQFLEKAGSILSVVQEKSIKTSMRQILLALSEHMTDPSMRAKALSLAVEDVIMQWIATAPLFESTISLFTALVQKRAGSSTVFTEAKTLLDVMLLTSKRVSYPQLPIELWAPPATQQTPINSISYEEYCSIFPFAPAWQQFLPIVFRAIETMHSFWTLEMRQQIQEYQRQLEQNQQQAELDSNCSGEVVRALYTPQKGDVIRAAGIKGSAHQAAAAAADSSPVGKIATYDIKEFLIFLYQSLGQSASHKSLYFQRDQLHTFLQNLSQHLPYMENHHLTILLKSLVEPLVLNAMPMFYSELAPFLCELMNSLLVRLSIAWDRTGTYEGWQQEQRTRFAFFAYRECSIPSVPVRSGTIGSAAGFGGLAADDIENARDHIIGDLTKAYVDLIASFMGLRGFLFTPSGYQLTASVASAAVTAAQCGGSAAAAAAAAAATDDEPSHEAEQLQLEVAKQLRRESLQDMFMGILFPFLTKKFIASVIALICLPDTAACRVSIQVAQKILDRCAIDNRFVVPIAQDAFSAAIMVLLRQEKWSVGIEWDIIEFLVDVYVMLVLGEGRQPVNTQDANGNIVSISASMPHRGLTDIPRQILLSLYGMTIQEVETLENNFKTIMGKKKRRGLMKDFLTETIKRSTPQGDVSTATGSIVQPANRAAQLNPVLDVRGRFTRSAKARYGQQQTTDAALQDGDLSQLFD